MKWYRTYLLTDTRTNLEIGADIAGAVCFH